MRSSLHSSQDTESDASFPADCDQELVKLVSSARAGDERAWEQLYARFTPMLRSVARSYRLSSSDVDDAVQMVWLLLLNHIGRLRRPAAVGTWLTTTTRRECLRVLRGTVREPPSEDCAPRDVVDPADPESLLLAKERRAVLRRALETLPERQRQLMTLLAFDPTMDYYTMGTTLAMPVGSIGPTRARSLDRLRCHSELRDFCPNSC